MGIFDIFKKKQPPALGLPPAPLNIPPADEIAEFMGNIPPPPLHPASVAKQEAQPTRALPDIEGKISGSELPPLPPLPPVAEQEQTPEEKQETLFDDIELPSPSEIGHGPASHEQSLIEEHTDTEPELLTFPEIPREVPEEKLFEPEQRLTSADDFGIPTELPSLEATHWPTQPSVAELPERPFIFLHAPAFKEIMASIDNVKDRARQSAKSEALITLKNREDSALNQLQGNLESIQRKLLYVDAALFEKQEA